MEVALLDISVFCHPCHDLSETTWLDEKEEVELFPELDWTHLSPRCRLAGGLTDLL